MDQVPEFPGTQCLGIRDVRLASCFYCLLTAVPRASTRGQHGHPLQSPPISPSFFSDILFLQSLGSGPYRPRSPNSAVLWPGKMPMFTEKLSKGESGAQGHADDPGGFQKSPSPRQLCCPVSILSPHPQQLPTAHRLAGPQWQWSKNN